MFLVLEGRGSFSSLGAALSPFGGVWCIVCGDVVCKLVARTTAQMFSRFLHALTTKCGCECVANAIQSLTDLDSRAIVMSIDWMNAFDCFCAFVCLPVLFSVSSCARDMHWRLTSTQACHQVSSQITAHLIVHPCSRIVEEIVAVPVPQNSGTLCHWIRSQINCAMTVNGSLVRTQSAGSTWPGQKNKGLQFWQTRSHAIILYDSVRADCIGKVVSLQGDKFLFQRVSMPRLAPKLVLKDA